MQLTIKTVEPAGRIESRAPNHRARMVIPPANTEEHSPFLVMAEDWFAPPAGFPTHPHRGIETVTFVLSGELIHGDHTGGAGRLHAGDAQFMTAGGGVMHSEMPGPEGVRTLQLWLNLPARLKRAKARYQDMLGAKAPVHRRPGVEARVYAGRLGDIAAPYASTWPLSMFDVRLEAGAAFDVPVAPGERAFAYVVEGKSLLGAEARAAKEGEVAWAAPASGAEGDVLNMNATSAARLLIFASPIIDEPVVMGGPFVMNTKEEILEAFADLRAGRLTQAT